ncbi:MAG: ABC transporter permease [Cyclobacteriaceae bacterium]
MLKNYLLIAYRNIKRNKFRTLVHVLGLSLGVAVCLLVFQLVWFEYSFDRFHPDRERIYQVNTLTKYNEESWPNNGVPVPLAEVIQEELPEIEMKSRFFTLWGVKVYEEERDQIYPGNNNVVLGDRAFFELFPRKWLAGQPSTSLEGRDEVVLTAAAAEKYFKSLPAVEVLGKNLTYFFRDTIRAKVVGVVEDFQGQTDLNFTDIISIKNTEKEELQHFYQRENWNSVNSASQLFVKLYDKDQEIQAENKLLTLADQHLDKEEDGIMEFSLLPLKELHFHNNFDNPAANKLVLNGLMVVSMFILILASMNFVNLETARSIIRVREVGIRKTLGSSRPQLIFQFLAETGIIVCISIIIGLFLCEMLSRYFAGFLPPEFTLHYVVPHTLIFLLVLGMVLTVVSGIFPSLILSSYRPHRALKMEFKNPSGFSIGHFIQKNLTVFQFALSIGFFIAVMVVADQNRYLLSKELGFNKEQVLHLRMPFNASETKKKSFKSTLEKQSMVRQVSLGNDALASSGIFTTKVEVAKDSTLAEFGVQIKVIDDHFLEVYQVPLLAGRNIKNVDGEMLVNQSFLRETGIADPREALDNYVLHDENDHLIVGVVPDFHSRTLKEGIRPMVMFYRPKNLDMINLKLHSQTDLFTAKSTLDGLSKSFFPHDEATFQFLDETIDHFYQSEVNLQKVLCMATLMVVTISFLGLFALTSFTIAQKTKEMSIRKILGATLNSLIMGHSKEYMVLTTQAFVLGAIPAWYLLRNWLADFPYRIDMPLRLFGMAGLSALAAILAIVGLHAYQVARKNPAEVLKSE